MDEKVKKIVLMVLGVAAIVFLILFLTFGLKKKYTPEEFDNVIVEKAKSYFEYNEDELPEKDSVKTLSLQDLETLGIIKSTEKMLSKDASCSGSLIIENNNNYYMYSTNLNCSYLGETYNTNNLKDLLISKKVTSGNGIYQLEDGYYYRGEDVDNYLIFDGILWRITKVNLDGSIRLIEDGRRSSVEWDNSYNADKEYSYGINSYIRNDIGISSSIKQSLDSIYESEDILTNAGKGFIKKTNLCIGKRSENETVNNGSIECSNLLENQYLGLLQLNEYFLASLDSNCTNINSTACINYNYLATLSPYWTLTGNSENTYQVYKIDYTPSSSNASSSAMNRMVINISSNTTVSGEGTEENPYVVSGFDSTLKKF